MKPIGQEAVLRNLNNTIRRLANKTHEGLEMLALYLIAKAKPRTPLKTGHLRSRYYYKNLTYYGKPAVEIGNDAEYALSTHEGVEKNFKVGQAKYLQETLVEDGIQGVMLMLMWLKV